MAVFTPASESSLLTEVQLEYGFVNAGSMAKRLLRTITRRNAAGRAYEPPYRFGYYSERDGVVVTATDAWSRLNPDTGALYGALATVVKPQGETVQFSYASVELGGSDRSHVVVAPDPIGWSDPHVTLGGDFVIVTWQGDDELSVTVYEWMGSWVAGASVVLAGAPDQAQVKTGIDFFAVLMPGASASLSLFHRNRLAAGQWIRADQAVSANSSATLVAGDSVCGVLSPSANALYVYGWSGDGWSSPGTNPTVLPNGQMLDVSAASNYVVAIASPRIDATAPATVYRLGLGDDAPTVWSATAAPVGPVFKSESGGVGLGALTIKAVASYAVVQARYKWVFGGKLFFDTRHFLYRWWADDPQSQWIPLVLSRGDNVILSENENAVTLIATDTFAAILAPSVKYLIRPSGQGVNGAVITNSLLNDDARAFLGGVDATVGVTSGVLGDQTYTLYQFEPVSGRWQAQEAVVLPDDFDLAYLVEVLLPLLFSVLDVVLFFIPLAELVGVFGDVLVNALITGASVALPVGLMQTVKPVDEAITGLRYLVVGAEGEAQRLSVFARGAAGTWKSAPNTVGPMMGDLTSDVFCLSGDFAAIEIESFGTAYTNVLGFRNGAVVLGLPLDPADGITMKPSADSPVLAGPGIAIGYPRSADALEDASQLTLYRYHDERTFGPVRATVVSAVTANDGYQASTTFYTYEPSGWSLDAIREQVTFSKVTVAGGGKTFADATAQGWSEHYFYTGGAVPPAALPPPQEYEVPAAVAQAPAVVTRLAFHERHWRADGAPSTRWQTSVRPTADVTCVADVGDDDTIWVASSDGKLHAIAFDGSASWQLALTPGLATVRESSAGRVYVTFGQTLYAVDPPAQQTGKATWQFASTGPMLTRPLIAPDGSVVVCDYNYLYVLDPARGSVRIRIAAASLADTQVGMASAPTAAPDGTLVFALANPSAPQDDGWLYVLDTREGRCGLLSPTSGGAIASPAVAPDGTVYAITPGGLSAFAADGAPAWTYSQVPCDPRRSPVLGFDGTIYASTGTGITAIARDGTPWRSAPFPAPGTICCDLLLGSEGDVFAAYVDGTDAGVIGLRPNGNARLTAPWILPSGSPASINSASEQQVFVTDTVGNLYCVAPDGGTVILYQSHDWTVCQLPASGGSERYVARLAGVRSTLDETPSATTYTYDLPSGPSDTTVHCGGVASETTTHVNGAGEVDQITTSYLYAGAVYPELAALQILAAVVQTTVEHQTLATVDLTSADRDGDPAVTTDVTVTTWSAGSDSPAPNAIYRWLGTGLPAFTAWSAAPSGDWLLTTQITAMAAGEIVGMTDALGVSTSLTHDKSHTLRIARFANAAIEHGEAYYTGFEAYEDLSGWPPMTSYITTDTAATGCSSLHLPAGIAVSTTLPDPGPRQGLTVIAAMVRTGPGFGTDGGSASIGLSQQGGGSAQLTLVDTAGDWSYQQLVVDWQPSGSEPVMLTMTNSKNSADVWIDDVRFQPVGSSAEIAVYDPDYRTVAATIDSNGRTVTTVRDDLQRPIAAIAADGTVTSFSTAAFSRDLPVFSPHLVIAADSTTPPTSPSGLFRAAETFQAQTPNAGLAIRAGTGGRRYFGHGGSTSDWQGAVAGDLLLVASGATARLPWTGSDVAVRIAFVTPPTGWDPIGPENGVTLSIGTVQLEHRLSTTQGLAAVPALTLGQGTQTVAGPAPSPLGREWLMIVVDQMVLVYIDGVHALAGAAPSQPGNDIALTLTGGTGTSALACTDIVVIDGPRVSAEYRDGAGRPRQRQAVEGQSSTIIAETLYDALGRPAIATLPVRKGTGQAALLGFEPGFVEGRDPSSGDPLWSLGSDEGTMAGLIQSWIDAQYKSDYPYRRTAYEASPVGRVIATGDAHPQFRIGQPHATTYAYGRSPEATATLSALGLSALEASCQIATRYDPLNDTDKRASMTITDTLGDTLVSAVAGPTQSATLVRTRTYPAGGMTVVTKLPNGTTVTEQYDQLGRLGATTSPDAGTAQYAYDQLGRLRYRLDADNVARYCRYDPLGRVTAAGYLSDTEDIASLRQQAMSADGNPAAEVWLAQTTYDTLGPGPSLDGLCRPVQTTTRHQQTDIDSEPVTESYAYDPDGRLTAHTTAADDQPARLTGYGYSPLGDLASLTYPHIASDAAFVVSYAYTRLGQIAGVADASQPTSRYAQYLYNADGSIASETLAAGPTSAPAVVRAYTYNSLGWLTQVGDQPSVGNPLFLQKLGYQDSNSQFGNSMPIQSVRHLADHDRQHHHREKLHQPHKAEIERIVGELIDLPGYRHALHHERAVAECARMPEQNEGSVVQQTRFRGERGLGHGQLQCGNQSGMASSVSMSRLSKITSFSTKASPLSGVSRRMRS